MELDAQQDAAIAHRGSPLLIAGGPGTGKTFTVRAIVQRWRAEGKEVLLIAPDCT